MKLIPGKIMQEAVILIAAASVVGISVNTFHPNGVKITNIRPPLQFAPDTLLAADLPGVSIDPSGAAHNESPEPRIISTDQVAQMMKKRIGILVDARSESLYAASHIPGAVNIPYQRFADYAAVVDSLPRNVWLICYCDSPGCDQSELLAYELLIEGFDYITIYHDGLKGWTEAGFRVSGNGARHE
ncbi:MAG: rhodanese-like domain-containing protein [Candidatus Zhuqueibacterota bacterium]